MEMSEEIRQLIDDPEVVGELTSIFDALRDPTRVYILAALMDGKKSVSQLKDRAEVTQSAVSHQLRLLRDRGLVKSERDGQRILYSLADDHVSTLLVVGLTHAAERKNS